MTQAGGNPPIRASEALLKKLAKIGLHSEADLLVHLPLRYEDETRITPVERAFGGEPVQVEVVVHSNELQFRPRRQMVVRAGDGTGDITLRFFSFYPSQQAALSVGSRIRAFGEVRGGFFGAEMVHPRFRKVADDEPLPEAMTPIYPSTAGLANSALQKLIGKALATGDMSETLPEELRQRLKLPALARSLKFLHNPPPGTELDTLHARNHPAWRRVKFDEVLAQQLSLRRAYLARREQGAPVLRARDNLGARLLDSLPFGLTGAQARAMAEIGADLAQPHPMHRLLQGDVGAGKTIVAALAACQAISAGWQAAFMAPTEILAEQHFLKLSGWLEPLGVKVAWLSGSLKSKARREQLAATASEAQLIVGTHALIQEGVDFARLGLAIVDEQHRFGVAQRLALRKKGNNPHQLMMSATPIPRTLAMSYYADLDVTVLDGVDLEVARGETLGREPFGICELVAELAQTVEPLSRAKGIAFTADCECSDIQVVGDRKAVAGALTNLLENAVQALDAGGAIHFNACLDGPLARFAVSDNGCGIEPALQSRLFEPFFTTRHDGTGLGLAIARGVARAHGGDIRIDSEPGRGTTFTLTLAMGA